MTTQRQEIAALIAKGKLHEAVKAFEKTGIDCGPEKAQLKMLKRNEEKALKERKRDGKPSERIQDAIVAGMNCIIEALVSKLELITKQYNHVH